MPTTVAFLPPVFVPFVTAASSSVSLSLCCRPSASLRSPSGSPFEPSKPRLPIIVACTAAPFNEFEAKVRAQKQLCMVAEFSESTCLGVEETIHCDVFVGFSQRLVSPSTRQLESCPSVNACLPA
nr:PREDICTED: uncharacterized protein LOC103982155 isoform X3 [Musa acuminata subsp. malaccensis]XP_018680706.1 PREDICTED: uncharacterized protein LOC103982155 isoform X3 [Musa acuminata subsp. malaccensis]